MSTPPKIATLTHKGRKYVDALEYAAYLDWYANDFTQKILGKTNQASIVIRTVTTVIGVFTRWLREI